MPFPSLPSPNPWTPRVQGKFIEPLMVTFRELVLRDQAAALAWIQAKALALGWPYPSITLPPFAHVLYANREEEWYDTRVDTYPLLLIQPANTRAERGDEEIWIPDELNTLAVTLVIWGEDADRLTVETTRYVSAVDKIWTSASPADLTWNLDSHTTQPVTDVVEHVYSTIRSNGPNNYLHIAGLTCTATFAEQ